MARIREAPFDVAELRRLAAELDRVKAELLRLKQTSDPPLRMLAVDDRTNAKASQFSVKTLFIVTTAFMAGMALARQADPLSLPFIASVVSAVSGACFFPQNRVRSATAFGSIGGFAGSLEHHALVMIVCAILGAAWGLAVGHAVNALANRR